MEHSVFTTDRAITDRAKIDSAFEVLRSSGNFSGDPVTEHLFDASEVRRVIRARRLRDQFFGCGMFADPVWDVLLDLFAAELEGRVVSVSSVCTAAAVAPTTALRCIRQMTDAGLLDRTPDIHDRRRSYLSLSDQASLAMRRYVVALRRSGLAMG